MTDGIVLWWRERTQREQRLLLVMAALLALVLAWLLVVRPLSDALDTAKRRHEAAVERLAEARAREAALGQASGRAVAVVPLPIDSLISRTATEAGFAGARITGQGPARASLVLDAARPQAFFGWVAQLEGQGLIVESLRARANPDQTIAVEAALRARSG